MNSFGTRVLVRVSYESGSVRQATERMLERLTDAWRDASEPTELVGDMPVVRLGEVSERDFEQIHSTMSTQVTLASLKARAGNEILLHAGGVAHTDGGVAVIVGPSGRGKTTTTRFLARSYGYVSDETIAIKRDGEILPYRKPLSVIQEGHNDKLQIAPSDLGLLPLPDAKLHLSGIAMLERAENGELASKVTSIGLARGLAAIVEQSSYLVELDRPLAAICELVAPLGGIKLLTVGEPSRIHEVAEQLFQSGASPYWQSVMPASQVAKQSPSAAYLPAPICDAVECEDGTIVFTQSRKAVVLTGIGPQLWRGACLGESWDQLTARIESAYGPAPTEESRAVIRKFAEELIEIGVLAEATIDDSWASHE